MMQKSMFTIDGIEAMFEGHTDGSHWNGWACPYFTKEVADQTMTCSEPMMTYDTYTYVIDEDNTYYFQGMDIDGIHLYPIGNGSWVWDNLAEYQSAQSKKLLAYLQEEYYWPNYKQLYEVYYGILQQIDGYMNDEQVKIFADGFMTAYQTFGEK